MKSKSSPELRPNRFDAIIAALVALLAIGTAVLFYGSWGKSGPTEVVITHAGAEMTRLSLTENREISVDGDYHLTITVENGAVSVTHSDCPTQDCVRTGTISRTGQSIICLPEQVVVKLVGSTDDGPDLVIG